MFVGRGDIPNISVPDFGDNPNLNLGYVNDTYWYGRYYVVYAKNFLIMELSLFLLIALTIFFVYLFNYNVSFNDPISSLKNTFLTCQLIAIVVSIIASALVTFITKSKKQLIQNLRIVGIFSVAIIIASIGIKISLDNTYNKNMFENFYQTYKSSADSSRDKKNIRVGLSGVGLSTAEEAYVQDSINAYNNFKVKTAFYIIIYILITSFIFFMSFKLSSVEEKKEKVLDNDAVLFDNEENIKF